MQHIDIGNYEQNSKTGDSLSASEFGITKSPIAKITRIEKSRYLIVR